MTRTMAPFITSRPEMDRATGSLTAPLWRVLRGGSWNNNPRNLRSANRNRNAPENRNNNVGFRVASTSAARAGGFTDRPGALLGVQGRS